MVQATLKSILLMMLLIAVVTVPGLIISIIRIFANPSELYNYIYLTLSILILLILVSYALRLFGPAKPRVPIDLSED